MQRGETDQCKAKEIHILNYENETFFAVAAIESLSSLPPPLLLCIDSLKLIQKRSSDDVNVRYRLFIFHLYLSFLSTLDWHTQAILTNGGAHRNREVCVLHIVGLPTEALSIRIYIYFSLLLLL